MAFFILDSMITDRINTISYWNEYAKWYKLWREHNSYHEPIINTLLSLVKTNHKIIDIGAGDGVLCFPLLKKGFDITVLEPSKSMRDLIYIEANKCGIMPNIISNKFEDLSLAELDNFNFLIACNSLHLTEYGLEKALDKLFQAQVENIFLVTEQFLDINKFSAKYKNYQLILHKSYCCESSFAYHSYYEMLEHWRFKFGGKISEGELNLLFRFVDYRENHIWLRDFVRVQIFLWRLKKWYF